MDNSLFPWGSMSFFFNSILPYPGNAFSRILFYFNILFASFNDISSILFLSSVLVMHPYTVISTRFVFFFDQLPL